MLAAECLFLVLYFSTEYRNFRHNIIVIISYVYFIFESEAWPSLFWEYIIGKLFPVYGNIDLID